jgi:hypothetical protein
MPGYYAPRPVIVEQVIAPAPVIVEQPVIIEERRRGLGPGGAFVGGMLLGEAIGHRRRW